MIGIIARKELTEIVRDGRLRVLGALVLVLALAALAFGVEQTQRAKRDRDDARERTQSQWKNQGDKNPHVAAHYGTYVFAPTDTATAIDPGVSRYLGRIIKLEAHKRRFAEHTSAEDGTSGGDFSVATVLLLLMPLLIIALGYGMWTLERERGTLRQVLSTQINRRALFWGKLLALLSAIALLLIPASLIVAGVLWTAGGGDASTLSRLALFAMFVGIYWVVIAGLTLLVSATMRSSQLALVALIGIWGVMSLIAPRLSTEVAGQLEPLPSRAAWAKTVSASLENGIDGKTPRDIAVEAIVSDKMAAQGMESTGMMVDSGYVGGLELQAEAEWEDSIFDHHMLALEDSIERQEQVAAMAGFLSPYLAIKTLSAGLCGTDYFHHRHFSAAAERYRKSMVESLNQAFADQAGFEGWEYEAGLELWAQLPPFTYEPPSLSSVLAHYRLSVIALLLWLALVVVFARLAATRVKVVG
jgi:ABC-2 type transport system permease protein